MRRNSAHWVSLAPLRRLEFFDKMEDNEADFECDCEDCLSQKPTEPLPSDCCGSGCEPCVNDLYEDDMKTWRKACYRRHHDTNIDHKVFLYCFKNKRKTFMCVS